MQACLRRYGPVVEPLPETLDAADELDPVADDALLVERLTQAARLAKALVPDLVGVSLASPREGITMTLQASAEEIAVLDAVQYAVGGPCLEALHEKEPLEYHPDPALEEGPWQLFALAAASETVRSTLTLPIVVSDGSVVGSVNLYAASRRAFEGNHEALADLFGAWAPGAVTNADLSFSSRLEAQQAPQRLRDRARVETAVGLVAADAGTDVEDARRRLEEAAARAQVPVLELAEAILEARNAR